MVETILLKKGSFMWEKAESFIRETYTSRYNANIDMIKGQIIATVDSRDQILCAAGLRSERDGFFSESYLQASIEDVLSVVSNRNVPRNEIFEVSTLASRAPGVIAGFIGEIVAFGETSGFSWSFFTLTSRLLRMIERLGFEPICLATADHRRIDQPERWGDYYTTGPKVFAVSGAHFDRERNFCKRALGYAQAV